MPNISARIIVAVGLMQSWAIGHAAQIEDSTIASGNWTGAAYYDDNTGEFSHCAISAHYQSGMSLHFSVNSGATISVGVFNPQWNLQAGERFSVSLHVDRRRPFFATALAVTPEFVILELNDFAAALDAMKRGRLLRIEESSGWEGFFDLTGTFRALDAATECAIFWIRNYQPRQTAVEAPSASITQNTQDSKLYEIAAKFLAESNVDNFTFGAGTGALAGYPVSWSHPQGRGGVRIVAQQEGETLNSFSANAIARFASTCEGDFVAGSSFTENVSGFSVRIVKTGCATADGEIVSTSTAVQVGQEFFEIQSEDFVSKGAPRPNMNSRDFAIRTVSFIVQ